MMKNKASDRFLCVRDMYNNVDPKHCPKVTISDIKSEDIEEGTRYEPIDQLYFDSNIQYAKSSW